MNDIHSNPFNSSTFKSIWNRHFNDSGELYAFESIEGPSFYKKKYLPIFINAGRRFTQGVAYKTDHGKSQKELHGKVFLWYDVPEYFGNVKRVDSRMKLTKLRQYHGYYAHLEDYERASDYMVQHIRPKSRRLINRSKTRLEKCFDVHYETLIGPDVPKELYDTLFEKLKLLLDKRYSEKDTTNIYLSPTFWSYLKDLVYPLLIEGKANIIAIYANDKPISINVNYLSKDILFSAHPVFDTDYACFNIGHISTLYTMEWCIANNIKIYDFSKGHYDYKKRWGSHHYFVDYHLLYDSKSPISIGLTVLLASYFKFKFFLRSLNVDGHYHQFKSRFKAVHKHEKNHYTLELPNNREDFENKDHQLLTSIEMSMFRKEINEFLFKTQECDKNISMAQLDSKKEVYLIFGAENQAKIFPVKSDYV